MHNVTDRQADRQTDMVMPITDHSVQQYDRLIKCNQIRFQTRYDNQNLPYKRCRLMMWRLAAAADDNIENWTTQHSTALLAWSSNHRCTFFRVTAVTDSAGVARIWGEEAGAPAGFQARVGKHLFETFFSFAHPGFHSCTVLGSDRRSGTDRWSISLTLTLPLTLPDVNLTIFPSIPCLVSAHVADLNL